MTHYGDRRPPGVSLHRTGGALYLQHDHAPGDGYAEWRPSHRRFVCRVCNDSWKVADLTLRCPTKGCRGLLRFDGETATFVCLKSRRHQFS
jgi:hypothetical protein